MENQSRRLSRLAVFAVAVTLAGVSPALAQGSAVVLYTSTEQIPLKAYAELLRSGVMQLASGAVKDIPVIADFRMVRCSLTGWRPGRAVVASEALFKSEYAERRLLPIATRRIGVTALEVRIADLESPEKIGELLAAVGVPEGGETGYFFFTLAADGLTRYYPFKFKRPAR